MYLNKLNLKSHPLTWYEHSEKLVTLPTLHYTASHLCLETYSTLLPQQSCIILLTFRTSNRWNNTPIEYQTYILQ